MADWKKEFDPSYDIPQGILDLIKDHKAEDLSWHNDTSPAFGLYDVDRGVTVDIHVEHPDPRFREFPNPRFVVFATLPHKAVVDLVETDDINEAISRYIELVKKNDLSYPSKQRK